MGKKTDEPIVPFWVWIAMSFGVVGAFAFVAVLAMTDLGIRPVAIDAPQKPTVVTRQEFLSRVIRCTPAQIVERVGRPDDTHSGVVFSMTYRGRTVDTLSGKIDSSAVIFFRFGVCDDVHFN